MRALKQAEQSDMGGREMTWSVCVQILAAVNNLFNIFAVYLTTLTATQTVQCPMI